MNSFFSTEGPVISFLDKCGRIILLSLLWAICCIPVITVSSSSSAFYYGITKTIRHERSSSGKEFFRCFKRCFKQGIISSLGFLILTAVLIIDIMVWYGKSTKASLVNMNLCIVFLLILIALCCYFFAVQSRFKYSVKELVKFSAFLTFKHLPTTALILVIVAVLIYAVAVFPYFLLFLPGLACMAISYFMENVFKKYIPKPEEGEEVWYDE